MGRSNRAALFLVASLGVAGITGCGGGGGSSPSPIPAPAPSPAPPPPVQPNAPLLSTNSYANFKQIGLTPQTLPAGYSNARAYGNFSGNGRLDFFRAVVTYNAQLPPAQATSSRFEFYARQQDGSLSLTSVQNGCIHPRKAIVADFNNDTKPDIFVACHGYDAPPFPGERSKVVLSQPGGGYAVSDASVDSGFFHGATAADLNGDNRIDVIVVDNSDPDRAFTLLNDGTGRFTREARGRLPSLGNGGFFTVELVDVDGDGRLDLFLGGHEWEAAASSVFINPGSNSFAGAARTVLPAVSAEGVVLDLAVSGSGSSRTLWLVRTSGGDGTFYQSKVVQKISYPALTSSVVFNGRPAQWMPWIIPATVNGAAVMTSDNLADGVSLPQ